jgi:hypothetical protein
MVRILHCGFNPLDSAYPKYSFVVNVYVMVTVQNVINAAVAFFRCILVDFLYNCSNLSVDILTYGRLPMQPLVKTRSGNFCNLAQSINGIMVLIILFLYGLVNKFMQD